MKFFNNKDKKPNDIRDNVKNVMTVILILFIGLISYIAYFQTFKATDIAQDQGNKRLWAKRNEVIRGTIYDRNNNALTSGERTGVLTQSRKYTNGTLYANVLGYVSPTYGLTGVEEAYDEELTSYNSVGTGIRDFLKSFDTDALKEAFLKRDDEEIKIGNSVKTSLDPTIQKAAYDALNKLGNVKGAAVAINPKTGEILAMVSKPTYDPNNLDDAMKAANAGTDGNALINRAIAGKYPPGSTFKTITTTSALQNIKGITSRTFNDDGVLELGGGMTLPNVGKAANGNIDLEHAFLASSNVVYGTLALELGNDKLKETAEKFGFNKEVSAEGFNIVESQFPTFKSSQKGLIAQCGIGQSEILATPMQMALVCSTIANDGVMMSPKLVNSVVDIKGNVVKNIDSKKYSAVMTKGEADTIQGYMQGLANNLGLFEGLNAAGKTGTAENSTGKDHSWFIGFAPADNPQIAVAVIVESSGFGAQYAGPVAASMMYSAVK